MAINKNTWSKSNWGVGSENYEYWKRKPIIDTKSIENTAGTYKIINIVHYDELDYIIISDSEILIADKTEKLELKGKSNVDLKNLEGRKYLFIYTKSGGLIYKELNLVVKTDVLLRFLRKFIEINIKRNDRADYTFVTTDKIELESDIIGNIDKCEVENIQWLVRGVNVIDGSGLPFNGIGKNFSFVPKPLKRPKSGSREMNPPIQYEIFAELNGLRVILILKQDKIDILRQEYIDFDTDWKPTRDEINKDTGGWNTGNYEYIATQGNNIFQNVFDNIIIEWNALCVSNNIDNQGVKIESAYRNPRRNITAGSHLKNSLHTRGRAIDLNAKGIRTTQKYTLLKQAAQNAGYNAICDKKGYSVPCDQADHIHVQW